MENMHTDVRVQRINYMAPLTTFVEDRRINFQINFRLERCHNPEKSTASVDEKL